MKKSLSVAPWNNVLATKNIVIEFIGNLVPFPYFQRSHILSPISVFNLPFEHLLHDFLQFVDIHEA